MNKKVYKKNKKVVENVIFVRRRNHKKLNLSILFVLFFIFSISTFFYYLNVWFFVNSTTPPTIRYISTQIGNIRMIKSENSGFVPFSTNWKSALLNQHKTSLIPQKKKILTEKKSNGSDQIIWHGSRDKKEIALTFDADITPIMVDWIHDGQVASYDDTRITNYLLQHQIKATFFLTGLWIELYPKETSELSQSPLFEFENHSFSHPSMISEGCFGQPEIPASQYPFEIEKTQQLIEQYTHQTPKYFRFPGGCYDQADLELVKKEGLVTVHWDDVSNDGFNDNEQDIISNVLNEAEPGGIIVMHMGSPVTNVPQTFNALPTIIDTLEKRGYTFVTVNELINPPQIVAQVTPAEYLTSLKYFKTPGL